MPTYAYEALNSAGKPHKGTIEAGSSEEAIARIKSQGYFPTSVREQKVKGEGEAKGGGGGVRSKKKKGIQINLAFGRVGLKKLTTFTRQLSTLQDAGLPLLRSLQILAKRGIGLPVTGFAHHTDATGKLIDMCGGTPPDGFAPCPSGEASVDNPPECACACALAP